MPQISTSAFATGRGWWTNRWGRGACRPRTAPHSGRHSGVLWGDVLWRFDPDDGRSRRGDRERCLDVVARFHRYGPGGKGHRRLERNRTRPPSGWRVRRWRAWRYWQTPDDRGRCAVDGWMGTGRRRTGRGPDLWAIRDWSTPIKSLAGDRWRDRTLAKMLRALRRARNDVGEQRTGRRRGFRAWPKHQHLNGPEPIDRRRARPGPRYRTRPAHGVARIVSRVQPRYAPYRHGLIDGRCRAPVISRRRCRKVGGGGRVGTWMSRFAGRSRTWLVGCNGLGWNGSRLRSYVDRLDGAHRSTAATRAVVVALGLQQRSLRRSPRKQY